MCVRCPIWTAVHCTTRNLRPSLYDTVEQADRKDGQEKVCPLRCRSKAINYEYNISHSTSIIGGQPVKSWPPSEVNQWSPNFSGDEVNVLTSETARQPSYIRRVARTVTVSAKKQIWEGISRAVGAVSSIQFFQKELDADEMLSKA